MAELSTQVFPKDGEGVEIYATLGIVNNTILVTDEGEYLDRIIIRNLANGLPVVGRVKITVERID